MKDKSYSLLSCQMARLNYRRKLKRGIVPELLHYSKSKLNDLWSWNFCPTPSFLSIKFFSRCSILHLTDFYEENYRNTVKRHNLTIFFWLAMTNSTGGAWESGVARDKKSIPCYFPWIDKNHCVKYSYQHLHNGYLCLYNGLKNGFWRQHGLQT